MFIFYKQNKKDDKEREEEENKQKQKELEKSKEKETKNKNKNKNKNKTKHSGSFLDKIKHNKNGINNNYKNLHNKIINENLNKNNNFQKTSGSFNQIRLDNGIRGSINNSGEQNKSTRSTINPLSSGNDNTSLVQNNNSNQLTNNNSNRGSEPTANNTNKANERPLLQKSEEDTQNKNDSTSSAQERPNSNLDNSRPELKPNSENNKEEEKEEENEEENEAELEYVVNKEITLDEFDVHSEIKKKFVCFYTGPVKKGTIIPNTTKGKKIKVGNEEKDAGIGYITFKSPNFDRTKHDRNLKGEYKGTYSGEFKNGSINGNGKLIHHLFYPVMGGYNDLVTTHEGGWKKGKRNGEGVTKIKDLYSGTTYKGCFNNGKLNSGKITQRCFNYGEDIDSNNNIDYEYEGEINSKFEPHGKGIKYDYELSRDKPPTIYSTYIGAFDKGKREGKGQLTIFDPESTSHRKIVAQFHSDEVKTQKGEIFTSEGDKFEGNICYSYGYGIEVMAGKGKITYTNGDIFEGEFNNRGIGEGKMIYHDGTEAKGTVKTKQEKVSFDFIRSNQILNQQNTNLGTLGPLNGRK